MSEEEDEKKATKVTTILNFIQMKLHEGDLDLHDVLAISAGLYTIVKVNTVYHGNRRGRTRLECEDMVKDKFE